MKVKGSNFKNIDEYIENFPSEVRRLLEDLRSTIMK